MEDFDTLDTDTPHEEDALTRGRFFNESGNASQSSLIAAYRTKSRTSSEYDDIGLDDDEVRLVSTEPKLSVKRPRERPVPHVKDASVKLWDFDGAGASAGSPHRSGDTQQE